MTYKKLEEIAEIFNGTRISRYLDTSSKNKSKIMDGKITNNNITYKEEKIREINHKFYSQKNDILIHLADSKNITLIKEENIIIPLNYAIIRTRKEYDPIYIYYILKSNQFQNNIERIREGTNIQFIRVNNIKEIKIKIPTNEKQTKFTKIMELTDKKINLINKKLKLEEEYKNSILQIELGENYVKL